MWDGGIVDLDLQPIAPLTSHVEMGETMSNVLTKLKNNINYTSQFKAAFGSEEINDEYLEYLNPVDSGYRYKPVMDIDVFGDIDKSKLR